MRAVGVRTRCSARRCTYLQDGRPHQPSPPANLRPISCQSPALLALLKMITKSKLLPSVSSLLRALTMSCFPVQTPASQLGRLMRSGMISSTHVFRVYMAHAFAKDITLPWKDVLRINQVFLCKPPNARLRNEYFVARVQLPKGADVYVSLELRTYDDNAALDLPQLQLEDCNSTLRISSRARRHATDHIVGIITFDANDQPLYLRELVVLAELLWAGPSNYGLLSKDYWFAGMLMDLVGTRARRRDETWHIVGVYERPSNEVIMEYLDEFTRRLSEFEKQIERARDPVKARAEELEAIRARNAALREQIKLLEFAGELKRFSDEVAGQEQ
ncbi:hypothetical protein B0H34DRAFT_686873 [Crassisporium funariophilum]|nr:hypothetical protein B0H34DRAFT_686873 [Crassisporium funariophilum]